MFIGQFDHSLDDKGRLTIPAGYRDLLASGAYVSRGFENNLMIWRAESFSSLYHKVEEKRFADKTARNFGRFMFANAAHVEMGEMECVTCHGDIGDSEHSRVYEENRLTGYSRDIWGKNIAGLKRNTWDRMKMDDCAECHRENGVNQASVQTGKGGCFVCHK